MQRLYDTGLYSQVQVSSAIDTNQAKLDMLLRVTGRRPRWVDLGIGSGSVDLLRFTGAWGNRNLDHNALLGSLGGELTVDQQRRSFDDQSRVVRVRYGHGSANLVEPWLFGLRLQGQTGVFHMDLVDSGLAVGPLIGGQLWDLLHLPAVAFLPVALASIMLIVLGLLLPSYRAFGPAVVVEHTSVHKTGAAKSTPPTR